jgi:hypothetical protein
VNSQVLLGRPSLKDFRIDMCNGTDSWGFEHISKLKKLFSIFLEELTEQAKALEVQGVFWPMTDEDPKPWKETTILDSKTPMTKTSTMCPNEFVGDTMTFSTPTMRIDCLHTMRPITLSI